MEAGGVHTPRSNVGLGLSSLPAVGRRPVGNSRVPTVDKTKPLLDLWQRLPERRGEGPPSLLFQFVDGERAWLVGIEDRRLVRIATGKAVADLK